MASAPLSLNRRYLPYGRQCIDQADIDAVVKVLQGDWLTTGPSVAAFESAFAQRVDAKHGAACANGTAALHLAAMAIGLGENDQVIVPAITFLATANAARFVRAEVVFADVDPDSGLMLPEHAEAAMARADRSRLKAIFPVHLNGQCGDPAGLHSLAQSHGLKIVEDACHALGTDYWVGSQQISVGACVHSDLAAFSFHPVKTITTGEGGMVTGSDQQLIDRIRRLRSHGIAREPDTFSQTEMAFESGEPNPWYYEMSEIGYNYRVTDFQCALGLSQLSRLDGIIECRKKLVAHYRAAFGDLAPAVRPISVLPNCTATWHLFVVLIDFPEIGRSRGQVMRALEKLGIGSQVHYAPLYRQPYYHARYGKITLPGAETYYSRCLSLPLFPGMNESDANYVVESLRSAIGL